MKNLLFFTFVICLVLTGSYNGSASGDQQDGKFAAVFQLVSVNGNQVPATISHDDVKFQISSGTFTFNADGTCISKMNFIPPGATAEASREVKATYKKEGGKLTMQWEGAGTTVGTLDGNNFSMDNEGMMLVYKK